MLFPPSVQFEPLSVVPLLSEPIPVNLREKEFQQILIEEKYILFVTQDCLHCWDIIKKRTFGYNVNGIRMIKSLG
jgi:hypothetical protein